MAGVTAHGATFTFQGVSAIVVGLSVEAPKAEVVDMTSRLDPIGANVLVPTGATSPGAINVDYIHAPGGVDPQALIGARGMVVFGSPGYSISRNVILESATTEAKAGDVVRGSIRFVMTDYYGA